MASLFYLREEMGRAFEMMNDKTRPFEVRLASRARYRHCCERVGAMERGGFDEDDPGSFLVGYDEIYFWEKDKRAEAGRKKIVTATQEQDARREARADQMAAKSEIQIAARETL